MKILLKMENRIMLAATLIVISMSVFAQKKVPADSIKVDTCLFKKIALYNENLNRLVAISTETKIADDKLWFYMVIIGALSREDYYYLIEAKKEKEQFRKWIYGY